MKYVISTTGSKIKFRLNKNRNFIFDSTIPTEVHETEFDILKKRLGAQLKIVDVSEDSNDVELPKSDIELMESRSGKDIVEVEEKKEPIDPEDESEKS